MGVNIGVFNAPGFQYRLEISNADEFIKRVKEINREARKKKIESPETHWKFSVRGTDRVPAAIQRLIDSNESSGGSAA